VDRPRREKKLATPELLAAAAGGSDGFIFAAKRARRREMKLARLVACAAVAVAATAEEFGTGPARLARCGGPCPGDFLGESLNYLRIAKSGSSSVVLQLRWMNGTNPKCHGLRMNRHETLARHMPPGSANFAVLREPCERFVSMCGHCVELDIPWDGSRGAADATWIFRGTGRGDAAGSSWIFRGTGRGRLVKRRSYGRETGRGDGRAEILPVGPGFAIKRTAPACQRRKNQSKRISYGRETWSNAAKINRNGARTAERRLGLRHEHSNAAKTSGNGPRLFEFRPP